MLKLRQERLFARCLLVLFIGFGLVNEPTASQTPQLSNMQTLGCYYSPELGELALALLATSNTIDPRQSYSFRNELGIQLEISEDVSEIVDSGSLKVAVLGDYTGITDREHTLFRFNIVMDESGSIEIRDRMAIRQIIKRFLGKIPVTFEIQLIRFTNRVSLTTGFTKDLKALFAALDAPIRISKTPRLDGGTAFYDAVDQGMKELLHASGNPVPLHFMIAFTDGADNASTRFVDFNDFKQKIQLQAERGQVLLFIAGIGKEDRIQHDLLEQVPGRMGLYQGFKIPDVDQVDQLFEQVANALNRTYIVRIPIVSSHRGTKTVYILRRKSSGSHDVIQDVPLPPSCIP